MNKHDVITPAAIVVALALGLTGAATPAAASAPAFAPSSTAPAGATSSCSWGAGSNPDTVNLAYPDLDASYS